MNDHFLKNMFGEDWAEKIENNAINFIGVIILSAFGLVIGGIYEWVKGMEAIEAATGASDKSSDRLEHLSYIGCFFQGTTGVLWALAGVMVIFLAFLIQAYQLAEQRKQFAAERDSISLQNFESRFFELLGYHRQNVSEIGIGSEVSGRRVFISLIREFREVFKIVDKACARLEPNYPLSLKRDLAYMAFYYGVGPNSTRVLQDAADYHPARLVEFVTNKMVFRQRIYRSYSKIISDENLPESLRRSKSKRRDKLTRLFYTPFDGHQSRLAHYYRHLYQLVKYLDAQAPSGTAAEYADIVRAQLTNHEQALLCLNALATIGKPWITLGYLTKYSLIKNIPSSFFKSTELDLEREFPKIRFEYMKSADSDAEPNR